MNVIALIIITRTEDSRALANSLTHYLSSLYVYFHWYAGIFSGNCKSESACSGCQVARDNNHSGSIETEADVSFECEGRNFTISGSLKQINFCYRLLLSLLVEEQEISDKLASCTFESAVELAGQRVIGEALSAGEKKNAPESIGTIVARPLEERPSWKVQYLGNVRQEGTERIMYPPMADKQTLKAKSLAISFIRQRYSTPLQNIQEVCVVDDLTKKEATL